MASTIVTFFFNIKLFPDATELVRSKEFYMEKGRVTLGLDAPMIVFCDDSSVDDIKAIRGDKPTEYVVKSIVDYDFFEDHVDVIRKNRVGIAKYVTSRNTPSYSLLTLFKVYAIYQAFIKNPFKTTHFAWIDFGGSHIMRDIEKHGPKMLAEPHPKISLCYIHYRSHAELAMTGPFVYGGQCGIGAGAFTVEGAYAGRFYHGCMSIFHEMLSKGKFHAEEQVLTCFYDRYPDLCTLYYGDYYSLVSNYSGVHGDFRCIWTNFIREARNKGRVDLAKAATKAVMDSVEKGLIKLSDADVANLKSI
jgi:hypothetical protein